MKKLQFLFLFSSFLSKLKIIAQALQTRGGALHPFLRKVTLNFDADFHELEEITKRAFLEVETEESQ